MMSEELTEEFIPDCLRSTGSGFPPAGVPGVPGTSSPSPSSAACEREAAAYFSFRAVALAFIFANCSWKQWKVIRRWELVRSASLPSDV